MASSTLVTCIDTALDDLLFVIDVVEGVSAADYELASTCLRNIKIFLLSSRKLGNDPGLESLLHMIEGDVCKAADMIHALRLHAVGQVSSEELAATYVKEWETVMEQIMCFDEQIDQFYITVLDTLSPSAASSQLLAPDEIDDLLDSVLKNLQLFHTFEWASDCSGIIKEPMKALGEQMNFLRNLNAFASESAHSKAKQDMLAHTESISICAAYIIFSLYSGMGDVSVAKEMLPEISALTEDIMPSDPRVHHTYTELLLSSKSGRRRLVDDPAAAVPDMDKRDNQAKEFLDSLISILWQILQIDTQDPMKDQFLQLYEGLGSLLFLLAQHPNTFDLKMKDQLLDVIYDAGVFIFSRYQTDLQLDHTLQDLLKAIRLILAEQLGETGAPAEPRFNIPTTAPLSFADFLLEKLTDLTNCEAETKVRSHAQTIQEELVSLRSFLGAIVELRRQKEQLQALWDRILELVYRIEGLLDYLVVDDLSDTFLSSFDSIVKDIKSVQMEIQVQKLETKLEAVTLTIQQSHVQPSQQSPQLKNEVVGYLEEATTVKNRLTRGSKNLQIVPIVGMAGQGKTTLAAKVYNDPSVSRHFSVCACSTVSQIVDKKKILLDLLSQIDPNESCPINISEYDLVEKVWRHLKGRRYLIFLDDIWEAGAWSKIKEAFPDDHMGSRVMLTSRQHNVVPNEEPHILRPFTEEESMDLLQMKLFPECGWPPELVDLGMKISQICKGLPLTILIVCGILANTARDGWETILGGLRSGMVSSTEQCRHTLELSYSSLPEHLRPCFLYFATFEEDSVVTVQRLLRLWIAEGFVRKSETKRIEVVAEDYLRDLIGRSLLMVARQSSMGGMKTCRIHDLLHEFCLERAEHEHFFSFLGGNEKHLALQAQAIPRRLCINFNPKYLSRSSRFFGQLRSMLSNHEVREPQNLSHLFYMGKRLRVLDLGAINLGDEFPSEIGLLLQLAFLEIEGYMTNIPPLIGNLSNLETFIMNQMRSDKVLSLPATFWNLQKLRHLYITRPGGSFPMENLAISPDLCGLDKLSGVVIPCPGDMEGLLKKFPNVRKLKFTLLVSPEEIGDSVVKVVVPECLSQLESLGVSLPFTGNLPECRKLEFSFSATLKKLSLSFIYLWGSSLATISKLPNLEVLKFIFISFEGNLWEVEEGEFSKLRFLRLSSVDLLSWSASEDQFECLEKLVLLSCSSLEELPSCLENLQTLAVIQVINCSNTVVEFVQNVKEVQEDNGNSGLKIITSVFD